MFNLDIYIKIKIKITFESLNLTSIYRSLVKSNLTFWFKHYELFV